MNSMDSGDSGCTMGATEGQSNHAASSSSELIVWEIEVPKVSRQSRTDVKKPKQKPETEGVVNTTSVSDLSVSRREVNRETGQIHQLPEAELGGKDLHLHPALHTGVPDLSHRR